MSWHLAPETLARYAAGTAEVGAAASVEAHVVACAACRTALDGYADRSQLDAVWAEVVDQLDQPRRSPVERLLHRCGLSDGDARLIAATPTLRLSWVTALLVTLAIAMLAAQDASDARAFLGLAPLLPVVGVATAYGRGLDPLFEIASAAPYSLVRLLLLRGATVLVTTGVLVAASALALPTTSWSPLVVIAPALALTLLSLLLSTALPPLAASAAVAVGWLSVVTATRRRIPIEAVTGSTAQILFASLAAAAALLLVARRDRIDLGGSA